MRLRRARRRDWPARIDDEDRAGVIHGVIAVGRGLDGNHNAPFFGERFDGGID